MESTKENSAIIKLIVYSMQVNETQQHANITLYFLPQDKQFHRFVTGIHYF